MGFRTLKEVVERLCGSKLVDEAKFLVFKLKDWIKLDGVTYKFLIKGFCNVGNLIEVSKMWNLKMNEGLELENDPVEKMMETVFKMDQFDEAIKLLQAMRSKRMEDLWISYSFVIYWMCRRDKASQANNLDFGVTGILGFTKRLSEYSL
ncbi:putative pentatricopeptide repeat-containing protein At1g26500 [Humulus lupulus]|uniref:putative pentatricopeptide repeat-containing protein At1g26500 n=1 Tax=Humulus lupulus TaxID=3486 RepID=UPI002B40DEE3|nr:putative pentatricopeptide repeat-containing protein At1g26500 [Humulus lupulus]